MVNLHEIFENARQEAERLENSYNAAFEQTNLSMLRDPPKEKLKINYSQDGVTVLQEWSSRSHEYVAGSIHYLSGTDLSTLTPEEILRHLPHVKGAELTFSYGKGLELPFGEAIGKYPLLREAIAERHQEELSLNKLIDIMGPIADMSKRLSKKRIEQIKKQVRAIPLITKWSQYENGSNPQGVASDLIRNRVQIEVLKTKKREVRKAMRKLTDPKFTEQVGRLEQRWEELDGELDKYADPSLERIKSYKEILYGEDGKLVEVELKKPYGDMKIAFALSKDRQTIRLSSQQITTGPNADISGVTLFAEPEKIGLDAWYGKIGSCPNSRLALSYPIDAYVFDKGGTDKGWKPVRETSVEAKISIKAGIGRADAEQLENVLTDMEGVINNLGVMD